MAADTKAPTSPPAPVSDARKWIVLLGAIIVQLILGTVYGYSVFWQPLEQEMGLAQTQATYAFSICILSFALTMVIAGRVQDIKGPRFTAIIGAVLMGVGFLIAGFMTSPIVFYIAHAAFSGVVILMLLMLFHAFFGKIDEQQVPILKYVPFAIIGAGIVAGVVLGNRYVGQLGDLDKLFVLWGTVGFLAGAGIGMAYVCPIAALVKWFPKKKGLVSGIAVAGFGFGAYLFKGEEIGAVGFIRNYGIDSFFMVHGVVCLVAVTIGAMMLKNPPDVTGGSSAGGAPESSWQDTLKRPAFYVLWIMFFSGAMAGLMVIGILKPFAGSQLVEAARAAAGGELSQAKTDALLLEGAAAVGYLAIFNAIGRIVWGFVSDWIGRTLSFVAMFVFQAVILVLLIGMKTELTLAIGASIIGFNFGGNFALFPSATADLFGAKNLGANYGWVFTSYGIAGVVGIAAWNMAKQHASPAVALTVAAVLCLISAGLAVGLKVTTARQAAAAQA